MPFSQPPHQSPAQRRCADRPNFQRAFRRRRAFVTLTQPLRSLRDAHALRVRGLGSSWRGSGTTKRIWQRLEGGDLERGGLVVLERRKRGVEGGDGGEGDVDRERRICEGMSGR